MLFDVGALFESSSSSLHDVNNMLVPVSSPIVRSVTCFIIFILDVDFQFFVLDGAN